MKFPKLVIEEAKALKEHATPEEINRLDFNRLNPESKFSCIYGQMTGDCFSGRAIDLITKSAKRVYVKNNKEWTSRLYEKAKLNGKPIPEERTGKETWWYSPIEIFISKKNDALNEKLIQFLKGEIKELK